MNEIYEVEIKGTRPLLMNSCRCMIEDRLNKPSRGTEEITLEEEAEKLLYLDKEGKNVIPSLCILGCLRKSAVNFKVPGRGKKTYKDFIYAGVRIEPNNIPLITENGWEVDLQTVVIGNGRIVKSRPRFDEWKIIFKMRILDVIIVPSVLKEMLIDAGKFNGLCDFRPFFGLFSVEKFERIENE